MTLRLNLGGYLQRHNITAYRLVNEVQGRVAPNTVYAMARRPAQRIDLSTVDELLHALERLTGEKVGLMDVVEQSQEVNLVSPTLEALLAQLPLIDTQALPIFKHDPQRPPLPLGEGPTIAQMISEGRESP
ncbi:hypothetical protein [Deinococcus sp.]|uniref:hypothetical protein n=1 Tax=Deinococcus sp. TaxID=47478 RepID=UPI003CC5067C